MSAPKYEAPGTDVLPFARRTRQVRKQLGPGDAIGPREAERDGAGRGMATLHAILQHKSTPFLAVAGTLKRIGEVERLDFRLAAVAGFPGVIAYVLARAVEAITNNQLAADGVSADHDSEDVP